MQFELCRIQEDLYEEGNFNEDSSVSDEGQRALGDVMQCSSGFAVIVRA